MAQLIRPTHDSLNGVMQAAEQDCGRNLDLSPDRRLDSEERDSELKDGRRPLLGRHKTIVGQPRSAL